MRKHAYLLAGVLALAASPVLAGGWGGTSGGGMGGHMGGGMPAMPSVPYGAGVAAGSQSSVAGAVTAHNGASAAGAFAGNISSAHSDMAGDPNANTKSLSFGGAFGAGQNAAAAFGANGFGLGWARW